MVNQKTIIPLILMVFGLSLLFGQTVIWGLINVIAFELGIMTEMWRQDKRRER